MEIVLSGEQNAHVQLSCQVNNAPACAVARNYVAFDKTTTDGKHYLAMFMSAQAMNASIEGYVDPNSCPADPGFKSNVAAIFLAYQSKSAMHVWGHNDQIWTGSAAPTCKLYSIGLV